ncbi:Cell division protein FtsI [Peptidoglycan synthetase] [hydrothermal vent metagenome]|uniref:Cell division protein FtsI [Peptidoglycan synthetase] n=1 Tax=hydrothermal vent metagenome TaxID=652676 RepID=A0A1W1BD05_9ZZZZ
MSFLELEELRLQRNSKLAFLFFIFVFLIIIFLYSTLNTILSDRKIPAKTSVIHDRSLRGDIISKDDYTLSTSHKIYQATVYVRNIDPDKESLFIKLFSIYSGMDEAEIKEKLYSKNGDRKRGRVILSKKLNAKNAIQLKSLSFKLQKLKVFIATKNRQGINVMYGLDIEEVGESREFPLGDCLTPIIGYTSKTTEDNYVRPKGKKGLERYAEKHLTSKKNGIFIGDRDVVGAIIRNGSSMRTLRIDGLDLHLNIVLSLQKRIEMVLDDMKIETGAAEILGAVMESDTGNVLAMASSERFDPHHIRQRDVAALNPKFSEYPYEVGSIMKPLTLSIALDHDRVTPNSWINTYGGHLKIGKRATISDDEKFDSLTATDIIVHSSNVGISQISWMLTGEEFRRGLLKFGLSQKSGIDLSRDLPGRIKPLRLLKNKLHRANQSYGYGMHATFAQMLKAYSAFNNGGKVMTPKIISYFQNKNGKHYTLPSPQPDKQAIKPETAQKIHKILLEVVKRGTGVDAQYAGLEIGGKTGTAHIATSAGYSKQYHSSFFGFANDKSGHKYTIGVLVIKASKPYRYFASKSAVPTFRAITNSLVELDYLIPKLTPKELEEKRKRLEAEKKHNKAHPNHSSKKPKNRPSKSKVKRYHPKRYVPKKYKPKPKIKERQEELFNDLDMF